MTDLVTLHLFNAPAGREGDLRQRVEATILPRARALRGVRRIDLFRCTAAQLQKEARQPWRHALIAEMASDTPEIDLPALGPLFADLRDAGLVAGDGAERIHSFAMYHPWKWSANRRPGPFSHLMFLIANIVPGHDAEYHRWYDEVHSVEVSESPGFVGMRRGRLCATQIAPAGFCPGSELILGGIQTDRLEAALTEFYNRAMGQSPSGIAWGPRSTAASLARTVHIFERIVGAGGD